MISIWYQYFAAMSPVGMFPPNQFKQIYISDCNKNITKSLMTYSIYVSVLCQWYLTKLYIWYVDVYFFKNWCWGHFQKMECFRDLQRRAVPLCVWASWGRRQINIYNLQICLTRRQINLQRIYNTKTNRGLQLSTSATYVSSIYLDLLRSSKSPNFQIDWVGR